MAIKKLQNNYTTPEQSKRLLELGVPADSADLYTKPDFENLIWIRNTRSELSEDFFDILLNLRRVNIPIWSVGRLIEIYLICHTNRVHYEFIAEEKPIDAIISSIEYAIEEQELDFSKLEE